MPSLRERLSQAADALLGRENRNVQVPFEAGYRWIGMPATYKPGESPKAYGDNPWLGGAVDRIAREIARTKFHLETQNEEDEIEIIRDHEALSTLKKPQPTKEGKSLLSRMTLKLITGFHLCLANEVLWLLDKRRKVNGAPTSIDLLLPQYVHEVFDQGELIEYVYRLPEFELSIRPQDILHFKLPNSTVSPSRA